MSKNKKHRVYNTANELKINLPVWILDYYSGSSDLTLLDHLNPSQYISSYWIIKFLWLDKLSILRSSYTYYIASLKLLFSSKKQEKRFL